MTHPETQPAVHMALAAIFVSLELSQSKWLITSLSPADGEKLSKFVVPARDVAGLRARLAELKRRSMTRTGVDHSIICIHEAGLDGFWLHRHLEIEGIESHVVDPASISVSRRKRRVKTDRIDGEMLVRTLLAYKRGDPRVCSMVRPPEPADEDRRRLTRERKALMAEAVRHTNRIKGLLYGQGIVGYEPRRRDRRSKLEDLVTGDGRPIEPRLKAQIVRELSRLELVLEQIGNCEDERDAMLASLAPVENTQQRNVAHPATPAVPLMLLGLRGIGPETASTLWVEGLSRQFDNRRQVASYAGLAPSHWQSGKIDHEQGVSKTGNPRLRTAIVQLAWLWVRHQPTSALTLWFKTRIAQNEGRLKKRMIVALARKLLVALWKYVSSGVVLEGAVMRAA